MTYREITINGQQIKLIPLGDCACGCGGKTNVASHNRPAYKQAKGRPLRYISRHSFRGSNKREQNPMWKGGRSRKRIYDLVLMPGHHRADYYGYVREHILIAEKALGHPLPSGAVVHHHTQTQLVLGQNQSYHLLLHQRTRAWRSCGHASWRKCVFCKIWSDPPTTNMYVPTKAGRPAYHRECKNLYDTQRRRTM